MSVLLGVAGGVALVVALLVYVSHCTLPQYDRPRCTCLDEHGRADPLTCRGCR